MVNVCKFNPRPGADPDVAEPSWEGGPAMTTTLKPGSVDRLYRAETTPQLVHVPRLRFLALHGRGHPNTSPAYTAALQALYAVSYAASS